MWTAADKVYTSYKKLCKDKHTRPVDRKRFKEIFNKQRRLISYMIDLGRTTPYIVSEIDKHFSVYSGVQGNKVVINILSRQEVEAFIGTESAIAKRKTI